MRWILLDLAIALAALAVLSVLVLRLWRSVKALSAVVTAAGDTLAQASDTLAAAQSSGAHGDASPPPPVVRGT